MLAETLEPAVGKRFVNLHDGRKAELERTDSGFCMAWVDRGALRTEAVTARKLAADWILDEKVPLGLRAEEIALVARVADNALRACDRHEPFKFYELATIGTGAPPHDAGLARVITEYLVARVR